MATVTATIARRRPPGPAGHPIWGSLGELAKDPPRFYLNAHRRYGDVVSFRSLGPFRWYMVCHPEDIERILRGPAARFPKDDFTNRNFRFLLGDGLFTSAGDSWLRQRRLAQPAFHRQRLAGLGAIMTATASAAVERWRPLAREGEVVDVAAEMSRLTLQIVGEALFGLDIGDREGEVTRALAGAAEFLEYRFRHPFDPPLWLPLPRHRRFQQARAAFDGIVYGIIAARRRALAATGDAGGDLLALLLEARDQDTGEAMSDRQLRDEVITLLVAGHETTAVTLTWTWYLLSRHPHVERALHDELAAVLGGRPPTPEDLSRLTYTRMVLDEALRLYPPAYGLSRQTREPLDVRGYYLPAGALIGMLQYVTHRHPEFWERPEEFDPERFTPDRSAGRPRFAYFPFGGGQRQCIGAGFALMEAQILLATLAQHFRCLPVSERPIEPDPQVTLRPRGGMPLLLRERPAGAVSTAAD